MATLTSYICNIETSGRSSVWQSWLQHNVLVGNLGPWLSYGCSLTHKSFQNTASDKVNTLLVTASPMASTDRYIPWMFNQTWPWSTICHIPQAVPGQFLSLGCAVLWGACSLNDSGHIICRKFLPSELITLCFVLLTVSMILREGLLLLVQYLYTIVFGCLLKQRIWMRLLPQLLKTSQVRDFLSKEDHGHSWWKMRKTFFSFALGRDTHTYTERWMPLSWQDKQPKLHATTQSPSKC